MENRTIVDRNTIGYKYKMHNVSLKHLESGNDLIEFLRVEIPCIEGHGPMPFIRVRFAYNGVEQESAYPMDLDKEAFLTRFEQARIKNQSAQEITLNQTAWKELIDTFQQARPEIIAAVRTFYTERWKKLF